MARFVIWRSGGLWENHRDRTSFCPGVICHRLATVFQGSKRENYTDLLGESVKSRLVLECKKTLNDLVSRNKVILTWVPGHSGVRENEEVDRLAREGSAMYPIGPEPILGIPYSMGVSAMKELLTKELKNSWHVTPGMRQAKAHIEGPSLKPTKWLLGMNRRDIKMVTGLLTGHCHLSRHLQLIRIAEDPECQWGLKG
ncbi:hypothetical protein NQ317_014533 [Molorchus minor]|uniref:RNase H type-1 domain-containing protein n=1 Tax=Molorchus minor TaxID=1323400 RepID=A0ABQ9JC38_9CUCU|nr:hypothetical protein NQ317_014533 [Molorchus minor]